jgi:hypothetical protein
VSFSGPLPSSLALAIALIAGCGRIGYEPVALVADRGVGVDAAPVDVDAAPVDVLAADIGPDIAADLPPSPPDLAPDAGPMTVNGSAICLAAPERRDLIADFEDGTLRLATVEGRGGNSFHLVQATGAGELSLGTLVPSLGACGSTLFMHFRGVAIAAGRNGHIQGLFINGPAGINRDYDARAFSGVRISLKASRQMSVSLEIPDGQTVTGGAYDHFSISLNVTTSWRTYLVPFASLRQQGSGTPQPALDLARLIGIELQILERDFDLWVDTIAFTR